jgi:hypothetical protein
MLSCYKIINKEQLKGITSGMDGILTWEKSSHGKEKNVKRFGFT